MLLVLNTLQSTNPSSVDALDNFTDSIDQRNEHHFQLRLMHIWFFWLPFYSPSISHTVTLLSLFVSRWVCAVHMWFSQQVHLIVSVIAYVITCIYFTLSLSLLPFFTVCIWYSSAYVALITHLLQRSWYHSVFYTMLRLRYNTFGSRQNARVLKCKQHIFGQPWRIYWMSSH